MSKDDFNALTKNEQRTLITDSLVWLCVVCEFNPFLFYDSNSKKNIEIIKIILGKYLEN